MTQEKQYKLFKLVNGDEIICTLDGNFDINNLNNIITIVDPIEIKLIRTSRGMGVYESYTLQPWLKYMTQTEYRIMLNSIIAIVDLGEIEKKSYIDYLNLMNKKYEDEDEFNELIKESQKQENESNKEFLKMILENLRSNSIGESSAEEENYPKTKRILH